MWACGWPAAHLLSGIHFRAGAPVLSSVGDASSAQTALPLPSPCRPFSADTLHANLLEVKELFEVKRFALFDQVRAHAKRLREGWGCTVLMPISTARRTARTQKEK